MLVLGTYDLGPYFSVESITGASRVPETEIPRRAGVLVDTPVPNKRIITLDGTVHGASLSTTRATLLSNLNAGRQKLYLWTDRYIWASLNAFTEDYDPACHDHHFHASIEFLCDDPYFYSDTSTDDTWIDITAAGEAKEIAVSGQASVRPIITLKADSAEDADWEIDIEGQAFTIVGAVTEDQVIVIDCEAETVTDQSTGDSLMDYFDGIFPELVVGNNTVTYTRTSGTAAVDEITTTWDDRWF